MSTNVWFYPMTFPLGMVGFHGISGHDQAISIAGADRGVPDSVRRVAMLSRAHPQRP